MPTKPTTAARLALLSTPLLLIGCAQTPSMTVSTSYPLSAQPSIRARPAQSRIFSELLALFTAPTSQVSVQEAETPAPGPQLVAGDWLAFQCALAGGYGGFSPPSDFAPTYAGVMGLVPISEQ